MNKSLNIARRVTIWIIILVSICALALTLAIASYVTVQTIQDMNSSSQKNSFPLSFNDYISHDAANATATQAPHISLQADILSLATNKCFDDIVHKTTTHNGDNIGYHSPNVAPTTLAKNPPNNSPLVLDKLGSYTTYFATSSAERKHNIALAARLINNCTILPDTQFSFNENVGARTSERGFQSANIILNGSFVQGIGGGVCQVSTTLYNAWVTSGLGVTSSRAHSLPVGYVPIARDAAVSSQIDLVLHNSSSTPVLIVATTTDTSINVTIYGKPDGYEYSIVSRLIKELPPPAPEYYYDIAYPQGEQSTIRTAKCGYIATSALQKFKNGKLISTAPLRQVSYQPIPAKIRIGGVEPMPLDKATD